VSGDSEAPDKEEVLFLSMQSIKASVLSDGASRQFIAQILGLQIDNQVRVAMSLPLVCFLAVSPRVVYLHSFQRACLPYVIDF